MLVNENTELFKAAGASKIVTISPHCYYTYTSEYPSLGEGVQIMHYTQLLAELVGEGRLALKPTSFKRVAYHDPCYLGRQSGVYDAPRDVISAIPDCELVELAEIREDSRCCGGGGGGIWKGGDTSLADQRVRDAQDHETEALLSACPYCLQMLAYSSQLAGDAVRVADIAELVDEASR